METSTTQYLGDLRTRMTHLKSGEIVTTDAPPDNHGRGEFFSPTDIVATALSSCMLTVLGIAARAHGFSMEGVSARVTKTMSAEAPRRISAVRVELFFPGEYSHKEMTVIERVARTCPVALSLHPDLQQDLVFRFGEADRH